MLAKTYSATPFAVEGTLVSIETLRQDQQPQIHITGLPNDVVKESRERVRACLNGLGIDAPTSRILVHLSPAHRKKMGAQLDLGIAMGVMAVEGILPSEKLRQCGFLGELSLDGSIRSVSAAAILIERLDKESSIENILLPVENEAEAALVGSKKTLLVRHVAEVIGFLKGENSLRRPSLLPPDANTEQGVLLDRIQGQRLAKRALEISLAGHHHFLMMGPPGVGKSLLANCSSSLLPPASAQERLEIAKNHAYLAAGSTDFRRPFRSPHHSISTSAFLGGGSGMVVPGEVTLAHHGILFMDELPEFRRDVMEGLREPLEAQKIFLHRVGEALTLPAHFILLAAMNPCPCGYSIVKHNGMKRRGCICGPEKVAQYRRKISGPLLERFDLFVIFEGNAVRNDGPPEARFCHPDVRQRIAHAWAKQADRYKAPCKFNGEAIVDAFADFTPEPDGQDWLKEKQIAERISYRSYHKLLRMARTIADIDDKSTITLSHLREANSLRPPSSLLEVN